MNIYMRIATIILFLLSLTSVPSIVSAASPQGNFDSVNNSLCQIEGWTKDPDSTSSLQVQVFRDGPFWSGTSVTSITANILHPDLTYSDKSHGFSYVFDVNSGLLDGKDHQLYLYGIDATGDQNIDLSGSPKTIHCQAKNGAKFVSQTVPTSMVTGQSYAVSVTMKNTGGTPWTYTGNYKLGSQNPSDNLTWGLNRVWMDSGSITNAGEQKTFTFNIKAPSAPGIINLQWKMVQELVEWFGDMTPNILITVASAPIPNPVVALTSVNVKDYGAKGDGVTDDSPAIQKAIVALAATGGTITIPAGTYMLGTSAGGVETFPNGQPIQNAIIINKPNVIFKGIGSTTVLKLMPHVKMRAISITGSNVTIDSIVVDGNKSQRNGSVPWPDGDVVDALVDGSQVANHITVQNCEVRNGIEDGIGFWKSDDSLVQNCYSHDNGTVQAGGAGISLSGGARARAIGNHVENNTATGIWSAYGSKNITIQNNIVKNNDKAGITIGGFTVDLGSGDNNGFTISGNTISGNGKVGFDGIIVASAVNGSIYDNNISDNVYDSMTITDDGINPVSSGWTVTNNTCSNTTSSGTQKWGIRILNKSKGIVLKGNACQNNGLTVNDQIVVDSTASVNSDWKTTNTLTYGGNPTSIVSTTGSSVLQTANPVTSISASPVVATVPTVPPSVTTGSASSITTTGATLSGTITSTGNENPTSRGILYGLTSLYGATSTESGSFSTGAFTKAVSSLTCNTTYHYATYATNTKGTNRGSDATFTTSACPVVTTNTPPVATSPVSTISNTTSDVDTSDAVSSCVDLNKNLSYKNRKYNNKDDVIELQDFLNGKGYLESDSVTGFFGKLTEKAVAKFQKDNNLSSTPPGFVGEMTRAKIKVLSCGNTGISINTVNSDTSINDTNDVAVSEYKIDSGSSPQVLGAFADSSSCIDIPRNLHRGAESSSVSTLQKFLQSKGFLNENPSGFYGDKTIEAIKDYQASKGLPVTGMVYDFTRQAIKSDTCQ